MSRPDAELVARCRAGDSDAFEALYREHSPRLNALARSMTGSQHESEDLLQETLLAVHNQRHTYLPDQPVTAWAYAIARYKLVDYFRHSPRHQSIEGLEVATPVAPVVPELPEPATGAERAALVAAPVLPVLVLELEARAPPESPLVAVGVKVVVEAPPAPPPAAPVATELPPAAVMDVVRMPAPIMLPTTTRWPAQ